MTRTITIGGNTITVVAVPNSPGFESIEFSMTDTVAIVSSPFTGQTQAFKWPGADMWTGTATLPKMRQAGADKWIAFVMQLRGMANGFMLGDPLKSVPTGLPSGVPVADGSIVVTAGSEVLYTKGWTASTFGLLNQGDYLQIGYRLHRVLDIVSSDSSGKAAIAIWPTLREVPTDGETVILNQPQGLFRLGANKRTFSSDYTKMTSMSFQIMEYR